MHKNIACYIESLGINQNRTWAERHLALPQRCSCSKRPHVNIVSFQIYLLDGLFIYSTYFHSVCVISSEPILNVALTFPLIFSKILPPQKGHILHVHICILLDFTTYKNLVLANTIGNHKPPGWTWHSPDGTSHQSATSWWKNPVPFRYYTHFLLYRGFYFTAALAYLANFMQHIPCKTQMFTAYQGQGLTSLVYENRTLSKQTRGPLTSYFIAGSTLPRH